LRADTLEIRPPAGRQAVLFGLEKGAPHRNRKSGDRGRTIFDNVPEVAWVKDGEGRFVAASPMFAEACGVPQRRLIGRTDWDIWPGEVAARHAAHEKKVVGAAAPDRTVFSSAGEDGAAKWTEIVRTPIVGGDGQIMGTLGIARDISPYKLAASRLLWVSRQVIRAREEEKKKISNLLHDEIGSLIMRLGTALYLAGEEAGDRRAEGLKEAKAMVKELASSVRNICFEIRPPALGVLGLDGALAEVVRRFSQCTEARIYSDIRLADDKRIDGLVKIIVYRIIQEALNNAVKYSSARTVRVGAWISGGRLKFTVNDDGKGFDADAADSAGGPTLGLRIMREEAESVSGEVSVSSAPGFGTTVRGDFPLRPGGTGGTHAD
jgi:PAS domain S-box-containing protein